MPDTITRQTSSGAFVYVQSGIETTSNGQQVAVEKSYLDPNCTQLARSDTSFSPNQDGERITKRETFGPNGLQEKDVFTVSKDGVPLMTESTLYGQKNDGTGKVTRGPLVTYTYASGDDLRDTRIRADSDKLIDPIPPAPNPAPKLSDPIGMSSSMIVVPGQAPVVVVDAPPPAVIVVGAQPPTTIVNVNLTPVARAAALAAGVAVKGGSNAENHEAAPHQVTPTAVRNSNTNTQENAKQQRGGHTGH